MDTTFVHDKRGGTYRVTGPPRLVSGGRFWRPGPPGTVRLWQTTPPAVPDTRGVRGHPWTFAHAALLSLAYVWKDQLGPVRGRGDERQLRLVDAVSAAGAAVVEASSLRVSDYRPYVHKVNPDAVIRPYRARLWLGDLGSKGTVQAIGQTRHLGGGLLVPIDEPVGAATGGGGR